MRWRSWAEPRIDQQRLPKLPSVRHQTRLGRSNDTSAHRLRLSQVPGDDGDERKLLHEVWRVAHWSTSAR